MEKGFDIKNIISDRGKLGEGIYLLYFALMVGARAIGLYEGMTVYNITLVFGMCLFACKMIITKHSLQEYLLSAVFLALAAAVYHNTGEKGLLVCFTMMLGMKGVSEGKIIKVGAIVAGIIIMSKIFLGVFGFTSEIYYPQERDGVGMMFRHALGYAHPNTLHMNVLMLSMMVMYLVTRWLIMCRVETSNLAGSDNELIDRTSNDVEQKNKSSMNFWGSSWKYALVALFIVSLLVFGFNLYIFQYSGSRTGLLACIVYLIVNFWLFVRKKIGIFEKVCLNASFPFVCFVSICLPLILKGEVFDFVNRTIFTTRFSLARYFWSNNGISLFGIRLNNPDEGLATYGIDMAQLYLFLQLGMAAFVVISALTIWFINSAIKADRRAELAVLMGMLFLGIWEPLLYNLGFKNFVYVFMGAAIYRALDDRKCNGFKSTGALDGGTETDGNLTNRRRETLIDGAFIKRLISCISFGIIVGIVISMLYFSVKIVPTALYGDREMSESGKSLGMEAQYISKAEIYEIKSSGAIVVGYVDEATPMYQYSSEIAQMEYQKKAMSVGVWSGMFAMGALAIIEIIYINK